MTIRKPKAFFAGLAAGFDGVFEWDFLLPAFYQSDREKQIEPMDWDAVVERRGKFLVFETKDGEVPIPLGQQITLESAVKNGGVNQYHIIILRSKTPEEINGWDAWHKGESGKVLKKHFTGDSAELIKYCRRWFLWASGKKTEKDPFSQFEDWIINGTPANYVSPKEPPF